MDYSPGLLNQYNYVANLPYDIKMALREYTQEGDYISFNLALRGIFPFEEKWRNRLQKMDLAFESVPELTEPILVYRGMASPLEISHHTLGNFWSTSESLEEIEKFITGDLSEEELLSDDPLCCLYKITVAAGSKVLPLPEMNEREVLLNRNGKLIVFKETLETIPWNWDSVNPDKLINTYYATYSS